MTTYESGSAVPSGYYLNPTTLHVVPVAEDGARLSKGGGRWIRIPTVAVLVLVPLLGALFLMFLPLAGIAVALRAVKATSPGAHLGAPLAGAVFAVLLPVAGFAVLGYALVRALFGRVRSGAAELAVTVHPGSFSAGAAYFTGRAGEGGVPGTTPALDEVEREIAERRER